MVVDVVLMLACELSCSLLGFTCACVDGQFVFVLMVGCVCVDGQVVDPRIRERESADLPQAPISHTRQRQRSHDQTSEPMHNNLFTPTVSLDEAPTCSVHSAT